MSTMTDPVRIHVTFEEGAGFAGESMWALPAGPSLYKVNNIPFFADGINLHDVVRCTEDDPEGLPEIQEVVERSGHRTYQVLFNGEATEEFQLKVAEDLRNLGAHTERAKAEFWVMSASPNEMGGGAFEEFEVMLAAHEDAGHLTFGTEDEEEEPNDR